jgi:hypothetical protein
MKTRSRTAILVALSVLCSTSAVASDRAIPAQAEVDACNRLAQQAVRTSTSAAATDAAAPSPGDPSLAGMAAAGNGNDIYRRAYAECMRGKLWSGT